MNTESRELWTSLAWGLGVASLLGVLAFWPRRHAHPQPLSGGQTMHLDVPVATEKR
jgi:hypothetical protein